MSVTSTHSTDSSSWRETLAETGAGIGAPAFYGPPVAFLFVPWLLLVLLLISPFAVVFAVGLVLAVAAVLLAALAAVVASPYLLLRHLSAHRARHAKPQASPRPARRRRVSAVRIGSPQVKGVS
jgi:hypothetical protein